MDFPIYCIELYTVLNLLNTVIAEITYEEAVFISIFYDSIYITQ